MTLRPTEILSFEHRLIEQVLDCLALISRAARDTGRLDIVAAEDAVDALWTLADRFHHGREEALFYALAERRGLPRSAGPVAAAIEEHAELHRALESMQDAVSAARMAAPRAAAAFHRTAEAAIELLRSHVLKEDAVLFPLADSLLNDDDRAALLEAFQHAEAELPEGVLVEAMATAEALARRFQVPLARERQGPVPLEFGPGRRD